MKNLLGSEKQIKYAEDIIKGINTLISYLEECKIYVERINTFDFLPSFQKRNENALANIQGLKKGINKILENENASYFINNYKYDLRMYKDFETYLQNLKTLNSNIKDAKTQEDLKVAGLSLPKNTFMLENLEMLKVNYAK